MNIHLVHWNNDEAGSRITLLRNAGHTVKHELPMTPSLLRRMKKDPPDIFIIDLSRLPSQGRDVALVLRETKATRFIPIVFAEGEEEKIARTRALLPDATYTTWNRMRSALKRAMARQPATPIIPQSRLAGYSGTPLPKKLGIKEGYTIVLINSPEHFAATLRDLPAGVHLVKENRSNRDLTIWFVTSRKELERRIPGMPKSIYDGHLWIAWPKKTSGVVTDMSEQLVREAGLAHGLVDFKICAIDATWSGLLFTKRKKQH